MVDEPNFEYHYDQAYRKSFAARLSFRIMGIAAGVFLAAVCLFFYFTGDSMTLPLTYQIVKYGAIVFIVGRVRQNETNRKTEVMLKAIESGATIDPNLLKPQTEQKSLKEKLLGRLTGACVTSLLGVAFLVGGLVLDWDMAFMPIETSLLGGILLAVGIALFVTYFAGKNMLAKEIEAEETALNEPQR